MRMTFYKEDERKLKLDYPTCFFFVFYFLSFIYIKSLGIHLVSVHYTNKIQTNQHVQICKSKEKRSYTLSILSFIHIILRF